MALLEGYARDSGLDVPRWRGCVQEERRGDRIASGTVLGLRSGVRGTPTFFVVGHGTIPGSVPLSLFRQILDQALAAEAGR
jgi:predicted DsbA family dithiol-disulfide isomerase